MSQKYSNRETVVDEARRVARQIQAAPGERFLIRLCSIDTLQEMFGGVDGPIRHESNYQTNMAWVWKA